MIGEKIINIMSEINAIEKKEIDEEKNYKFAKSEDIIAMVKPLLVKYKVSILPVKVINQLPQGNKVFITMKYQFVDMEDPKKDAVEVEIPGGGYDEKGRASYAALTGTYRYAMQQVFAIPVVDEIKNNDSENNKVENDVNGNLEIKQEDNNELIENMSADDIEKLFYSQTA